MQKHVFGEDIQAIISPLQRVGRCKQRKNIMFGALDLLSLNPTDPSLAKDLRALVDIIRAHVVVNPSTTKPNYVPLQEEEGTVYTTEEFFHYVRNKVHLPEISTITEIEELSGLTELQSLIAIASAVVIERDLRISPEDNETLQGILEALECISEFPLN